MIKEKVQPHRMVCNEPFKRNDIVHTDTMVTQIQHVKYFIYKPEFIKDTGAYEEIVNKYSHYKRSCIVSDKPITNLLVKHSLIKKQKY